MKKVSRLLGIVALCSLIAPLAMAKTASPGRSARTEKRAAVPHHRKAKAKRSRPGKSHRGPQTAPGTDDTTK